MSDDRAFVDQVTMLASCEPCELPQADLLRLLVLAGFGPGTRVYQDVQGQPGRVLLLREGALEMVRLARRRLPTERIRNMPLTRR